jgi:hypothetical protein
VSKLRSINWVYAAALVIVYGFMAFAGYKSYGHLVEFFKILGASDADANAAPVFVDGFVFLGWLGRRRRFAERTRRIGLRMMLIASVLSFAGNVTVGVAHGSVGSALFGGMLVVGYLGAEWYADQLAPARKPVRKLAPAVAKARAAKAAATRAAKKAAVSDLPAELPVTASLAVPPQPVHVVSPVRPRVGVFGLPRPPLAERIGVLSKQAA